MDAKAEYAEHQPSMACAPSKIPFQAWTEALPASWFMGVMVRALRKLGYEVTSNSFVSCGTGRRDFASFDVSSLFFRG